MKKIFVGKILMGLAAFVFAAGISLIFWGCGSRVEPWTTAQTLDKYLGNIVEIRAGSRMGTGFVMEGGDRVRVLANIHVAGKDADIIRVRFFSEDEFVGKSDGSADIEILGFDDDFDLIVFAVDYAPNVRFASITAADFVGADDIAMGQRFIGLGNALGGGISFFEGAVSRADRVIKTEIGFMPSFQSTATLNDGCSGAPLFSEDGRVLGIAYGQLSAGGTDAFGISFCIPAPIAYAVYARVVDDASGGQVAVPDVRFSIAKSDWMSGETSIFFSAFCVSAEFVGDKLIIVSASHSSAEELLGGAIIRLGEMEISQRSYTKIALEILKYKRNGSGSAFEITVFSGDNSTTRTDVNYGL